jgi:rsbT co-antagonist protein RsbR
MTDNPIYSITPSDWKSFEFLQTVIDAVDDPIFVKDLQHRWIACNQAFCALMSHPHEVLIGSSDPDYVPPDQVKVFWDIDDMVTSTGVPFENEEEITPADGVARTIWTRKFPIRDAAGQVIGLCGIITDITEIQRRREQVAALEAEIAEKMTVIAVQTSLLDQLAVPVIQVWESILLIPLVGVIDSRRANQVLTSMLESIARIGAQIVILDVTGVPVVDTAVASYLVRAVQSAQLLGCRSILVGLSPEIAQTLVGLGVDFSHITTRATLQNGLEYGLRYLNYAIRRTAS